MIKVSSKEEAWTLVNRLFPSEYQMDERRSEFAGYPVYYSAKEGEDALICDLGYRIEVIFPDGDSETVWINAPDDVVTTLGFVKERKVFPSVTIQEVEEKCLLNLKGLTFGEEAGKPTVKFWTSDEEGAVYFCDEVAYVQIGDVKKNESLNAEQEAIDFFMNLIQTGVSIDQIQKYLGNDVADEVLKFCKKHSLI